MNRQQFLPRCFIASSALVSVVQAIFFALQGVSAINGLGLTLAALTMLGAWRWTKVPNPRIVQIVATLLAAQFAVFAMNFVLIQPPMPHRLLQVAIVLSYGGTVLASLLSLFRRAEAVNVVLLPLSVGVALLIVEVLAGRVAAPSGSWVPPEQEAREDDGSGPIATHPIIGHHYRPYAFFKEYYPDNPRGYYREEDKALSKWILSVNESSAASMLFPEQKGVDVRVDITRAPSTPFWHIQLGQASFALRSGESYRLSFGVRADDSRSIIYAVSQAHEPWEDLGLYREIEVTGEWQEISSQFTATQDEAEARIHFDVGGVPTSVEVRDVQLLSLPEGQPVEPNVQPKYVVEFQFNGLGCRDRDYAIPKPPGTVRVLTLGDSFAFGWGVGGDHVVANQLEELLRDRAKASGAGTTYEVINCGVPGYSTRDERFFYELFGHRYRPDVVLVLMVLNDDRSWRDDVRLGYDMRRPNKLEHLFSSWHIIQQRRHRKPNPDFSGSVEELLRLNKLVQANGARLAVAIFRNDKGGWWEDLVTTVSSGLEHASIPVADLGIALLADHSAEDLRMGADDWHPNEVAHRLAAQELQRFLERHELLRSPDGASDPRTDTHVPN